MDRACPPLFPDIFASLKPTPVMEVTYGRAQKRYKGKCEVTAGNPDRIPKLSADN